MFVARTTEFANRFYSINNRIPLDWLNLSSEKIILHEKYKRLQNRINSMIKNDTIKYNNERVEKAGDENEMWKIVKDIIAPKSDTKWSLIEEDVPKFCVQIESNY